MTLPENLTLIRHGQSEANVIQKRLKAAGVVTDIPEGLFDRHDSTMRLTDLGVQQAQITGAWLRANLDPFDRFYVSPHTRTRETAAHLGLNGAWRVDDRFRERDWGEIHYITADGLDPLSEESRHNRELSALYWQPKAGESIAGGVRGRVESIMSSLYRKDDTHNVIGVAHGEFISGCQLVIERMTPDQWEAMEANSAYTVRNTMVLQYTRIDPATGKIGSNHFKWRRATCPWDTSLSWDGGEWQPIVHHKFSDAELLTSVEEYQRLL